ncbi:MAG: DMT family transporter [Alphaproteobacteria bacterium]|nr:DMT family transporter [Alphaproteobacteria bacterium]
MDQYLLAILIAFLPPILYTFSNLLESHMSNSNFKSSVAIAFYGNVINFCFVPFLLIFGMPQAIPDGMLWLVLLSAFCSLAYLIPYYAALKVLQVSVAVSLFAMSSLIVPVLSWFVLGERLHPLNYLGFAIVIASSFLISKGRGAIKLNRGFWYMAVACSVVAVDLMIVTKLLIEMDWISVLFYNMIFTSMMVSTWLLVAKLRRNIVRSWPTFKENAAQVFLFDGLDTAAAVAAVFSLSVLPVVVKDGISNTQPLFVLAIGVLLKVLGGSKVAFKESTTRREILRKASLLTFMLAGVLLLTL